MMTQRQRLVMMLENKNHFWVLRTGKLGGNAFRPNADRSWGNPNLKCPEQI